MRNGEIQKRRDIKIEDIGKNKHLTDIKTKKQIKPLYLKGQELRIKISL